VNVAGVGLLRVRPRCVLLVARDERPYPRPHEQDEHEAADELGGRERGTQEDPEHDAELEDEVRGGEHERQRGREPGALLEHALGDRNRRVGARGRGRPETRALQRRGQPAATEHALHLSARDPGLHDARQQEAEDQRPPHLPRHLEGIAEPVPDRVQHIGHRGDRTRRYRRARLRGLIDQHAEVVRDVSRRHRHAARELGPPASARVYEPDARRVQAVLGARRLRGGEVRVPDWT
jgi:hypothetical protein